MDRKLNLAHKLFLLLTICVCGVAAAAQNTPVSSGTSNRVATGTNCYPAVYNVSTTRVVATPLNCDATQMTGADAGAKIDSALTNAAATTPVDAEGFNGSQTFTGGSFGLLSANQRGELKLGCKVTFKSTTLPMLVGATGLHIHGCGSDSHLSTNDALNGVQFKYTGSAPGVPTPLFCFGDYTGGCAPVGGGAFNAPMEFVNFNANNILNVIPFNQSYAQELSQVSHLRVDNFKGDGIQISMPDETACTHCQNFFLEDYLAQEYSDACTATTHPLFVHANTFGIKLLKGTLNLNSGSGSCTTTSPDSIARISASGIDVDTLHVEGNSSLPGVTHGILLGQDKAAQSTLLRNISAAQLTTGSDVIRISNAFSSGNIVIEGVNAAASGATNLLNDQVRGYTLTLASKTKIGLYAIGENNDCSLISTVAVPNCFPSGVVAGGQPIPNYVAGAGTAQAQTATIAAFTNPTTAALTTGMTVRWLPTAANSATAPTLAVNGLTAKTITKCGTQALVANDLTTTAIAEASYDGTQFQLLNPQSGSCGQTFIAVATDSGTANTYVINPVPAVTLAVGAQVLLKPANASSGASTINVNGLGVKSITKNGTVAIGGNDLVTTNLYLLTYDGTEWVVMNNGLGCSTCARVNGAPSAHQVGVAASALTFGGATNFTLDATDSFPAKLNGETLAGFGVPFVRGVTSQKAETTTADANVLTVTPAATVGTYRACVVVSVSAATSGVISWTLSWTDSNGTAQSNIAQDLFQQGTAAPNTTFTTSAAGNYNGCTTFDVNNAAASIVVKWVGGGTTTAKMSAVIERVI